MPIGRGTLNHLFNQRIMRTSKNIIPFAPPAPKPGPEPDFAEHIDKYLGYAMRVAAAEKMYRGEKHPTTADCRAELVRRIACVELELRDSEAQ
jgi:hypothetical protein